LCLPRKPAKAVPILGISGDNAVFLVVEENYAGSHT
jgi:hypothetical protein